jgi:thioredoxin-like negative regulator of GroEL
MSGCNSDVIIDVPDKVGAFKQLLNKTGDGTPIYAFFYNPNCGHCHTLMSYFIQYRQQCSSQKAKAILVIINHKTAPELFQAYQVTSYPQVMVFRNNQRIAHIEGADIPALADAFALAGIKIK